MSEREGFVIQWRRHDVEGHPWRIKPRERPVFYAEQDANDRITEILDEDSDEVWEYRVVPLDENGKPVDPDAA